MLVVVASICCLLLAFEGRRPRWVDHVALLGEAIVVAVPALVLLQHVLGLDLGLDLVRTDAAAGHSASHPGRISPNACIALMCWGIALALLRRAIGGKRTARLWAIAAWTGAAMAISTPCLSVERCVFSKIRSRRATAPRSEDSARRPWTAASG